MAGDTYDSRIRVAAFDFLKAQVDIYGDTVLWAVLVRGFQFEGRRAPLLSQQGIFKPAVLHNTPISIRTTPVVEGKERPYDDEIAQSGLLRYAYQGHPGERYQNDWMRKAITGSGRSWDMPLPVAKCKLRRASRYTPRSRETQEHWIGPSHRTYTVDVAPQPEQDSQAKPSRTKGEYS